MKYNTIASFALVAGLAGCGAAALRPAADPVWSKDRTSGEVILGTHPDPEHEVVLNIPATVTPAFCRAWAPHVEEDEVPLSHNGAKLVDYDGMDNIGCALYADGWAYDGLGWIAPS